MHCAVPYDVASLAPRRPKNESPIRPPRGGGRDGPKLLVEGQHVDVVPDLGDLAARQAQRGGTRELDVLPFGQDAQLRPLVGAAGDVTPDHLIPRVDMESLTCSAQLEVRPFSCRLGPQRESCGIDGSYRSLDNTL